MVHNLVKNHEIGPQHYSGLDSVPALNPQLVFDLTSPKRNNAGEQNDFDMGIIRHATNQAATGWIDLWPDWPAPALILCGPPGSGKTSMAAYWARKTLAITISGADINLPGILAQRMGKNTTGAQDAQALRLVIDQADAIPGDRKREEALFHLYNQARDSGGYLLLLAETPPAYWQISLPDLRSRLLAAPLARIEGPDEDLLQALVRRHFAQRQVVVSEDSVLMVFALADRSHGGIRDAVAAIDRAALACKKPVTPALIRQVLLADQIPDSGD